MAHASGATEAKGPSEVSLELEHAIGFSSIHAGLHFHPATGEYIYAAGGCIACCDLADPNNHMFLRGHNGPITCLAVSASGRFIASGERSRNADVLVWDFASKRLLYRFAEHDVGVVTLAFSDDEKLLCSVGDAQDDGKMFIWDMQTGNIVTCCRPTPAATTCVTWGGFVKDIKRRETDFYQLATGGEKAIALWALDPMTGEIEPATVRQQQTRNVTSLKFSDDCETLYAGTTTGDFVVVNVKNKMSVGICTACSSGVHAVATYRSASGETLLVVGGGDGTIAAYDSELGVVQQTRVIGAVVSISLNRDQTEFIVGTGAGFIYRVNTMDFATLLVSENHSAGVVAVSYAPEVSDRFATLSHDCTIRVWDASSYRVATQVHVRDAKTPSCLVYTLDALITGWTDGVVRCYHPEVSSDEQLWRIDNAHRGGVTSIVISHNERFIITGGAEGDIRVWELRSRELVSHLKEHVLPVTGLALFEDDAHAISCSRDRSFLCWDLRAEKRISSHTQRMGGLNAVCLSRDQTQVLTVGQEKKISFWDLREETPIQMIDYCRSAAGGDLAPAPVDGVGLPLDMNSEAFCMAVSHHGRIIATGGTDNMVKIWSKETGALIMDGVGHSDTVRSLRFSPDDRQIVSVGDDGNIFVWNLFEL